MMFAKPESGAHAPDFSRRIGFGWVRRAAPYYLFLSICCGGMAASASSPQQIVGSALESPITGKRITFDEARMKSGSTDHSELFQKNGRYFKIGDRARTFGSYYYENDAICTSVTITIDTITCRYVYKDDTGYYFRYIDRNQNSAWPIKFSDLPNGESGGSIP